jgi:hypothetical protein
MSTLRRSDPRSREAAGRLMSSMAELQIEARRIIREWPEYTQDKRGRFVPVHERDLAAAAGALREVNAQIRELRERD